MFIINRYCISPKFDENNVITCACKNNPYLPRKDTFNQLQMFIYIEKLKQLQSKEGVLDDFWSNWDNMLYAIAVCEKISKQLNDETYVHFY